MDGVRGLAILAVMTQHLRFSMFNFGALGVNLFFVISGFLITGVLMDARGAENYFRNFYLRRALRILPIYYLSLAAVVLVARWHGGSVGDVWYYVFYAQDVPIARSYWHPHFPIGFNNAWSLAVEEQFYLIWPLAIYWLKDRVLYLLSAILFVVAFFWRVHLLAAYPGNPAMADCTLLVNADCLVSGACLCLFLRKVRSFEGRLPFLACLAFLSLSWAIAILSYLTGDWSQSRLLHWDGLALRSILPIFFASVVAFAALQRPRLVCAFLSNRLLVWVGQISYGLYLYHVPIYGFIHPIEAGYQSPASRILFALLKISLSFCAASLSWRFIETPLNRLRDFFGTDPKPLPSAPGPNPAAVA